MGIEGVGVMGLLAEGAESGTRALLAVGHGSCTGQTTAVADEIVPHGTLPTQQR